MNDTANTDEGTPGRKARAASVWGRSDLMRRVSRLPIPEESRARVASFVEEEVARARSAWAVASVPLAELPPEQAQELARKRLQDEIVKALKALGGTNLTAEDLAQLVEQATAPGTES